MSDLPPTIHPTRKGAEVELDLAKCKELGHKVVILSAVTYGGLETKFDGWCDTCEFQPLED